MGEDDLSSGETWPHHYRGLSLQVSPSGEMWWQLYQGTDRLALEPTPEHIAGQLLEFKRIGGRIHITEQGDVLTRVERDDDEYDQVYVGTVDDLDGELVPEDAPEYSIDLHPSGLEPGDLWPSVYDGSRYSFLGDRFWWHSGQSHKRHPVSDGLPDHIEGKLRRYKPDGGSFRVLPWGDVITLVSLHPAPERVGEQFGELPRVVRNIIKLRKSRDVEMLPVYIGSLDGYEITVEEPTSLTEDLSDEEQEELASWAENLGRTSTRSADSHRASQTGGSGTDDPSASETGARTDSTRDPEWDQSGDTARAASNTGATGSSGQSSGSSDGKEGDAPSFEDDPLEWMKEEIEDDHGESQSDGGSL
jgi:hypothetical protein